MIKISALNEEPNEESEDEDVPSKEVQEQVALTAYNDALVFLREDEREKALLIFQELLETQLLDEVVKPEVPDARTRPMLSLKYSCYKNVAGIQADLENYEDAIDNYLEAAHLDDSDVMLWYRIGTLAVKISKLELACLAFKQGLKCNPNHWPCLDSIITILYAVPDYMNCLLYISMAFERDPTYVKGLAFREKIFKDIPGLEESYKLYNNDWMLDPPLYAEFDHIVGEKLIAEAKDIAEKWAEVCKPEFIHKSLPELPLNKPIKGLTWVDLGESLLDMHRYIMENNLNFVSRVRLTVEREDSTFHAKTENNVRGNDMEVEEIIKNKLDGVCSEYPDNKETESTVKLRMDEAINNCYEISNDLDSAMEVEVEDDKKSDSSDIQIIEDEDPLKISDVDLLRFDEPDRLKFANLEGVESEAEKEARETDLHEINAQTEKGSDRDSDKSNDKTYEKLLEKENESKIDEKSNEKSEGKDEGQKVKKRRRSALCFLKQWAWSDMSYRRSARVRSSNRREAERDDVQLEETLRRIFPSNLLPDTVKLTKDDQMKNMEDSMDTMDLYELFANQQNNSNNGECVKSSESSKSPSPEINHQQKYFDTELENADVEVFVNEHSSKSNLMIIIAKFTEILSTKWNQKWPKEMVAIYLQAYLFTREHIPRPSPFEEHEDDLILKLDTEMTLLFGELHTDRWLGNKPDVVPNSTLDKFSTGMPAEELGHIIFTSVRKDLTSKENIFLLLRVLWLKANLFLCQSDIDIVIETLELLQYRIQELEDQNQNVCLKLPNCKCNSEISLKLVQKKLTSIQRGQKLGEIQSFYEEEKYKELSLILQDTFKFSKQKNKIVSNTNEQLVDRVEQLFMLLDSLWRLQQYEECYVWAEACLNEAWHNYLNASDETEQKKWTKSILTALEKLEACTIEVSAFVVKYLPESRLSRLVQNLVHFVCHQLNVSETTVEMPLETVLPWIILHYILQYEEDKERAKIEMYDKNKSQDSNHSESDDEDDGIPPSIMILFTAHEFIGRHSWCCYNEAKLLFFTMKLIIPKLETPQYMPIKNKLTKHLEQIFYCLYGHPNNKANKTKPKHLEDHGVPQMELSWEAAQLLFDFYKPKLLPEFQSPRQASITSDNEVLFKRIIKLVPSESDPSQMANEMIAYIMGEREKMPVIKKLLPQNISSIYYLLGDFYFKNNKWQYACQYYLLDLCLYPLGLNSWAGLAMATGTIIENWLNSYKSISEDKFLNKAKIAQSSYQHAIELSPGHAVIWTEYGNFVYMVHSFCSRTLKQETDTLSMERFEILETRKEEMLDIADHCFQSANRIFIACQGIDDGMHDERWLYQYMLGKIAEKKNKDPPIFLDYYSKASTLLYENGAQYPHRISHSCPQNLAIEALEVHYRIHASILKYLEQHDGKSLKKSLGQLFNWHLKNCSEGPFTRYRPKLNTKKKEDGTTDKSLKNKDTEAANESDKRAVQISQRSNSIEEIEIIDKNSKALAKVDEKLENRKRLVSEDMQSQSEVKRIKFGSCFSHLQLMQDVVALVEDLITNVCDIVNQKERINDDCMLVDSDESDEPKIVQRKYDEVRSNYESKIPLKDVAKTMVDPEKNEMGTEKNENMQDLMDALMKKAMEISQENQNSLQDDEDTRKSDGKWLQKEDLPNSEKEMKERVMDKKKVHLNKDEVIYSRRGSQESTTTTQTTTTTETNNSSTSSSDETSSSTDSSDSDTSSDTDSESAESDNEKKKKEAEITKEDFMTDEEVTALTSYCLAGLEQCILRFSEHYKSFYRLSHFYFNKKNPKNMARCKELLLETYNCMFYPEHKFQGLYADRRKNNFFNGIWHIPNREIDRPGSFASHMSRCVTLLMQVLKETNDSRMLMQLCNHLQKTPDPDKKYLRDSEREQLACQALTLCQQSLRNRVQAMEPPNLLSESVNLIKFDSRTQLLHDVCKIYQQVQKAFQGKEPTIQLFATLLCDTYKSYTGHKNMEGNILEIAIKYCQRQKAASKIAATSGIGTSNAIPNLVVTTSQVTMPQQAAPTSSAVMQNRKVHQKTTPSTGRPRGRPPNVNKYLHAMQQSGSSMLNQLGKPNMPSMFGMSANRNLINPYLPNPLVDPAMVSALLASGFGGGILGSLSAMGYLSQMGQYQDIYRQYQNNFTPLSSLATGMNTGAASVSNITNAPTISTSAPAIGTSSNTSNLGNMSNFNNLTVQQLLNISKANQASTSRASASSVPVTNTSITKDRPNISITPVGTTGPCKIKSTKPVSQVESLPMHIPKSLQISQSPPKSVLSVPPSQVSVLKSSIVQQSGAKQPSSKSHGMPQIRVAKSLIEPQPAHNPSMSHSPLKNTVQSPVNVPQAAHNINPALTIKPTMPINIPPTRSGTSLQHKLLSKKNLQRPYQTQNIQRPVKKPSKSITPLPQSNQNLMGLPYSTLATSNLPTSSLQPSYMPPDLSGRSVSSISQSDTKGCSVKHPTYKKSTKAKPVEAPLQSTYPQNNSAEALSMLTQLQQHSHLEIIPQQKAIKQNEFGKNFNAMTIVPQKMSDSVRPSTSESIPISNLSRNKPNTNTPKFGNDSVEIITLDD
ncbi:calcineurin-binding protein cabin-1-like [Prorops nasuta]|uniref:calcineurin-binding protein cabin-1-like n=1 Tax=Prorops nasuta TaxID=863751 RepID=UPI0034CF4D87